MSITKGCETKMTDQQILAESINTVMESIDPDLAQNLIVEISQTPGLNNVRGVFYDNQGVDIKIDARSLRPAVEKRLHRELMIAQEGLEVAVQYGDEIREQHFRNMENAVNKKISQMTATMYGDIGFRFDKNKGTYSYIYDEHLKDMDHGFGPNFANEVASTYAALELAQSPELQKLNAKMTEAIHPLSDDEGNFGMGCLIEIDEDTLIRQGIMQAL